MKICPTCLNTCEDYDLRPYGKNGAWICYDCAMATPESQAEAKRQFMARMDAAEKVSNVVVIGEPTGPRPLNSNSLV